jgi:hypothetical protein
MVEDDADKPLHSTLPALRLADFSMSACHLLALWRSMISGLRFQFSGFDLWSVK